MLSNNDDELRQQVDRFVNEAERRTGPKGITSAILALVAETRRVNLHLNSLDMTLNFVHDTVRNNL